MNNLGWLLVLGVLAGAEPALAQGGQERTDTAQEWTTNPDGSRNMPLAAFLEDHFSFVAKSCLPDSKPSWWRSLFRRGGDRQPVFTPSDITQWSAIRHLPPGNVRVRPTSSLNAVFAGVYDKSTHTPVGSPIGVTWGGPSAPLLYQQESSLRREHNCVTLLTAESGMTANMSVADIRAALTANTSSDRSQTAFAYAGVMVSPITAALGLNTTVVDAPAGVDPFGIMMAIWQWHAVNSGTDEAKLVIRNDIQGLALYRTTGLTQNTLLRGEAGLNVALPFVSAHAEATGMTRSRANIRVEEFAVADWTPSNQGYVPLPTVERLIDMMTGTATFSPVIAPSARIEDHRQPVSFAYDLPGVPSAYCRTTLWTASLVNADDENFSGAALTQAGPVQGDERRCRFSVTVTAKDRRNTPAALPAALTLRWKEQVRSQSLTFTLPEVSVPDARAPLSIVSISGGRRLEVNAAGDQPQVRLQGIVQLKTNDNEVTAVTGPSRLVLECPSLVADAAVMLRAQGVEDDQATYTPASKMVALSFPWPRDLIPQVRGTVVDCTLKGNVAFKMRTGDDEHVDLPTITFQLIRAADPAPAPQPITGAVVVDPGPG